jgi:hypothetical protein
MEIEEKFYLSVIFITFIVIIVFAIVWPLILKKPLTLPEPVMYTKLGYGGRCNNSSLQCSDGLTCVMYNENNGVCKVELNYPCKSIKQCEPSSIYCEEVCSLTKSGGLNQKGPCIQGLEENNEGICKLSIDQEGCKINSDCINGSCINNVCLIKKENGLNCMKNNECISNNCNLFYCQDIGINTGEINSSCNLEYGPICNTNLSCYVDYANSKESYGFCEEEVNYWPYDNCNINNACIPPSICYNGECIMPRDNEKYETNSCKLTQTCINGWSCVEDVCIENNPREGIYKWVVNVKEKTFSSFTFLVSIQTSSFSVLTSEKGDYVLYFDGIYRIYSSFTGEIKDIIILPIFNGENKNIEIISLTFTYAGDILVVYMLDNVVRCSFSSFEETEIEKVSFPVYVNNFQFLTNNNISLGMVKYIDVDDRIDIGGNLHFSYVNDKGDLFIGVVSYDYFIGKNVNAKKDIVYVASNVEWAQVYGITSLYNLYEYVFKYTGGDKIYFMTKNGTEKENTPPEEISSLYTSPVISQTFYANGDVNDSYLFYTVNYGTSAGGIQMRMKNKGKDVILPGNPGAMLMINKKSKTISNYEFIPKIAFFTYVL